MQLFVDGVEYDGSYSGTGTTMTYSGRDGAFGMRNEIPDFYHTGNIDDTRVYDRVLSLEEIEALLYERRLKP